MSDIALKEKLSEESFGTSTLVEIWLGEDGKKYKKSIQKIDKISGRILERCKNPNPQVEIVTTVKLIEEVVISSKNKNGEDISEEERLAIIDEKFRKKAEKAKRRKEEMRIAALDDDELEEEQEKKEKGRALNDLLVARNVAAQQNVAAQRELKAELQNLGKNKTEIKQAVKALKAEQKIVDEEETENKGKKGVKRGRPAKAAIVNPVKDPATGEFVSASEKK